MNSSTNHAGGPKALTYRQVARRLGVSLRFVEQLVADGNLPVVRLGTRTVRVLEDDLRRFIRERREGGEGA